MIGIVCIAQCLTDWINVCIYIYMYSVVYIQSVLG